MKDDFFEWLDKCPTNWFLEKAEEDDGRTYFFKDNDDDNDEGEEE